MSRRRPPPGRTGIRESGICHSSTLTSRACSSSIIPFGSGHGAVGGEVEVGEAVRRAVGVYLVLRVAERDERRFVAPRLDHDRSDRDPGSAVRARPGDAPGPACSTRCRSSRAGRPSRAERACGRPLSARNDRPITCAGCRDRARRRQLRGARDRARGRPRPRSGPASVAPTSNQTRRRGLDVKAPVAAGTHDRERHRQVRLRAPWLLYCSNTAESTSLPALVEAVEALAEPDDVLVRLEAQRKAQAIRAVVVSQPGDAAGDKARLEPLVVAANGNGSAVLPPACGDEVEPTAPCFGGREPVAEAISGGQARAARRSTSCGRAAPPGGRRHPKDGRRSHAARRRRSPLRLRGPPLRAAGRRSSPSHRRERIRARPRRRRSGWWHGPRTARRRPVGRAAAGRARPGTGARDPPGDGGSPLASRQPDERPAAKRRHGDDIVAPARAPTRAPGGPATTPGRQTESAAQPCGGARRGSGRLPTALSRASGCPRAVSCSAERSMRLISRPPRTRIARAQRAPGVGVTSTGMSASTFSSSLTPPRCVFVTSTASRSKSRSP